MLLLLNLSPCLQLEGAELHYRVRREVTTVVGSTTDDEEATVATTSTSEDFGKWRRVFFTESEREKVLKEIHSEGKLK